MTREFGPRVEDFNKDDILALKAEILKGWDVGVMSIAKAKAVVRAQDEINADLLEALEAIMEVGHEAIPEFENAPYMTALARAGIANRFQATLSVARTAIQKAKS